jgi:membrane protein DedA with SNARE-associated domain
MEQLIEHYGYLGVLIGTFLEGETILILGGFAAHRGYLALSGVILCAFGGSLLSDQLLFYLGRHHSRFLLRRRPQWEPRIVRLKAVIHRYRIPIILVFRFWYGLRMVTPFTLGMSMVRWSQFVILNMIAAILWAVVIGYAGYLFGQALETLLGDLQSYEMLILTVLALIGVMVWGLRRWKKMRRVGSDNGNAGSPSGK